MLRKDVIAFSSTLVIFILLACILQWNTLFSGDVGYLLYASKQILGGAKYGKEIFETNPPMILYLYAPVHLLIYLTLMDILLATKIYIFFLVILSSSVCYWLLMQITSSQDFFYRILFFCTLLTGLLLITGGAFAQREHIFIIFFMPYLLASVLALEKKCIPTWLAFMIGLFAGLGIALKPYFLAPLCIIELYFIFNTRRLFGFLRIETITVLCVLILYMLSIVFFQPGYLTNVLPLVTRYYFPMIEIDLITIFRMPITIWTVSITVFYILFRNQDRYPSMGVILFLSMIGLTAAYIIPQAPWYYHLLPALIVTFLMIAHCMAQAFANCFKKNATPFILCRDLGIFSIVMTMFLAMPLYRVWNVLVYDMSQDRMQQITDLLSYLKKHEGKHSAICLTMATHGCFPLMHQLHSQFDMRFPTLWWYPIMRDQEAASLTTHKEQLLDMLVEDMQVHKTRWVLINTQPFRNKRWEAVYSDILAYLLTYKKFSEEWKNYSYKTTILDAAVYERKPV